MHAEAEQSDSWSTWLWRILALIVVRIFDGCTAPRHVREAECSISYEILRTGGTILLRWFDDLATVIGIPLSLHGPTAKRQTLSLLNSDESDDCSVAERRFSISVLARSNPCQSSPPSQKLIHSLWVMESSHLPSNSYLPRTWLWHLNKSTPLSNQRLVGRWSITLSPVTQICEMGFHLLRSRCWAWLCFRTRMGLWIWLYQASGPPGVRYLQQYSPRLIDVRLAQMLMLSIQYSHDQPA